MKKLDLLTDEQIGQNLKAIIEGMGITQEAFGALIGKSKSHVSNYISAKSGCLAKNLLQEIVTLGFNGTWYLTGKGEMLLKDIKHDEQDAYTEAGKKIAEALAILTKGNKVQEAPKKRKVATVIEIPLYSHSVAAGIPTDSSSPVDQYFSLPKHMIRHPRETYAVLASGDSMTGAGIEAGDILIVDKGVEPKHKSIVIASINNEQMVKRLLLDGEAISLSPENDKYPVTRITGEMDFRTLGVVVWVIRKTG